MSNAAIPVILFVYARTTHLAQVLACLRENSVPLLYVFADGAKGAADAPLVAAARTMIREIDWCEVRMVERPSNLGLGRNVIAGIAEVAASHDAFVVWEDDLICVPGTYAWVCAALRKYAGDSRVMSVTAWNLPRVTPADVVDLPYFDGRAECWVWGAYARSWQGMEQTALQKIAEMRARGGKADAFGFDLPAMAEVEQVRNIWAVRWLYHHLQHGGLCVRPPWSMVEHVGFDPSATNAEGDTDWANPQLKAAPKIPAVWPEPKLHPAAAGLWRRACPRPWKRKLRNSLLRFRRLFGATPPR